MTPLLAFRSAKMMLEALFMFTIDPADITGNRRIQCMMVGLVLATVDDTFYQNIFSQQS